MRLRVIMNAHAYGITNNMVNVGFDMQVPKAAGGAMVGSVAKFTVVDIDPLDTMVRGKEVSRKNECLPDPHACFSDHLQRYLPRCNTARTRSSQSRRPVVR